MRQTINAGEMEVGEKKPVVPTRVTPEEKAALTALDVPPIPSHNFPP
ncbi:MAG TPA: hypothetical protein VGK27_04460 [Candidatus Deferrimicrobiaceae bacterium]|jgi:hypothetical protein